MKKYLVHGFYFLIPIYLYIAFIVIIDPYEFINLFHVIGPDIKLQAIKRSDATSPRGAMLWKMIHFNRNPKKNVIIGDSQSILIKESKLKQLTGKDFFNFSVPGSSYETIFETFWYVNEKVKPESVYFQLGFMNYNAHRSYSLFFFGKDYIENPYMYFTSKEIFYDAFYNLSFAITEDSTLVQKSFEYLNVDSQDEISKKSLKLFFDKYEYPTYFHQELERIVHYCNSNDIEVKFIIFPIYKDVHKYIAGKNLEEMNTKFKDFLKSLACTYDLETSSGLSENRSNFIDYFHPRQEIVDDLTKYIWGNETLDKY
jgi:hypothetical protein